MLLNGQRNLGIQYRETHLSQIRGLIPVFLKMVLAVCAMALVAARTVMGPLTWNFDKDIRDELKITSAQVLLKVKRSADEEHDTKGVSITNVCSESTVHACDQSVRTDLMEEGGLTNQIHERWASLICRSASKRT